MKKFYFACCFLLASILVDAQSLVCNTSGNLVIFSNYDGGVLNIIADANIPNLVIGIVSYEAVEVNFSGPFLNNITAVHYAGFNSNNNHCGAVIATTAVTGLPGTVPVSINFSPPSPVIDPNGNANIICAYDCDTINSQGGCNTVKQVEAYFLQQFPGSVVYSHTTQYGCWSNPLSIAPGGNCCAAPPPPLTLTPVIDNLSCFGNCDASITVIPQGLTGPYQYLWSTGEITAGIDSLCVGTYTIVVTDINGTSITQQYSITVPPPVSLAFSVVSDAGGCSGQVFALPSGGTAPFTYLWDSCGAASGSTTSSVNNLCAGTCCLIITDANGCADTSCVTIPSTVGIHDYENFFIKPFPNPSTDGVFELQLSHYPLDINKILITNRLGQVVPFVVTEQYGSINLRILSGDGIYFVNAGLGKGFKLMISSGEIK